MTEGTQEDRIEKLGELYKDACKRLGEIIAGDSWMTSDIEADQARAEVSLGIIDRWLQVREADRQYELRRYENG